MWGIGAVELVVSGPKASPTRGMLALRDARVGSLPRVGMAGLDENDDVVEGIVLMRKGENPGTVLV